LITGSNADIYFPSLNILPENKSI